MDLAWDGVDTCLHNFEGNWQRRVLPYQNWSTQQNMIPEFMDGGKAIQIMSVRNLWPKFTRSKYLRWGIWTLNLSIFQNWHEIAIECCYTTVHVTICTEFTCRSWNWSNCWWQLEFEHKLLTQMTDWRWGTALFSCSAFELYNLVASLKVGLLVASTGTSGDHQNPSSFSSRSYRTLTSASYKADTILICGDFP